MKKITTKHNTSRRKNRTYKRKAGTKPTPGTIKTILNTLKEPMKDLVINTAESVGTEIVKSTPKKAYEIYSKTPIKINMKTLYNQPPTTPRHSIKPPPPPAKHNFKINLSEHPKTPERHRQNYSVKKPRKKSQIKPVIPLTFLDEPTDVNKRLYPNSPSKSKNHPPTTPEKTK